MESSEGGGSGPRGPGSRLPEGRLRRVATARGGGDRGGGDGSKLPIYRAPGWGSGGGSGILGSEGWTIVGLSIV